MTRKQVLDKIEALLLEAEEQTKGGNGDKIDSKTYQVLEIVAAYQKLLDSDGVRFTNG